MAMLMGIRVPFFVFSAFFLACGSTSGGGGGAVIDGGAEAQVAGSGCASVASVLCKRAVACGTDAKARVHLGGGPSSIVYDSEDFCTKVFTDQCGPDVPTTYRPRVPDPGACGAALTTASCRDGALAAPTACGGQS